MSTDTTGGMTAEDWLSMSAQLQEYMTRKGYPAWEEAEVRIYRVEGIYDGTLEPAAPPLAQDDGVYRQLSAEEEVALRNSEKLAAIAAKNIAAQSGEVSSPPPAATTTPKYKATPQKLVVPGNFASSLKISLVLAHRSATLNTPIPTLSGKKVKFAAQEDASASVVDDDPAASTPALKSVVLQVWFWNAAKSFLFSFAIEKSYLLSYSHIIFCVSTAPIGW